MNVQLSGILDEMILIKNLPIHSIIQVYEYIFYYLCSLLGTKRSFIYAFEVMSLYRYQWRHSAILWVEMTLDASRQKYGVRTG